MARAKSGTRISHISIMNLELDTSWIDDHYDGILSTGVDPTEIAILTETGLDLESEDSLIIAEESIKIDLELITISFVGDSRPTPNAVAGMFKAS